MKIKCPRFNSKLKEESIGESVSFPYFFNTIKLVFLGSILSGCGTSSQFGFLQSEPDTYYKHPLNDTVTQPTEYGNKKFVGGGIFTRKIPSDTWQTSVTEDKNFTIRENSLTGGSTIRSSDGSSSRRSGNTTYHSDGSSSRISGNTVYHSDGSSSRRSGNTIYNSDGSSSRISGNTIYNSDGSKFKFRRFDQDGNEIFNDF